MQTPPHRITPYRGTRDTVAAMMSAAKGLRGERSLPVRLWVESVIRYVKARDDLSRLAAIYHAFEPRFVYTHDPTEVEQVKDPELLVTEMTRYGVCLGDCDDASTFLYAAPRTVGIRTHFVRGGFRAGLAGMPPSYSHVFVVAPDQHGRTIVLDPVAGLRAPRMIKRLRQVAVDLAGLGGFGT